MIKEERVISPMTMAEQLLYSTVRIVGDVGTGTGFFFQIPLENGEKIELILTNKHVIKDNKNVTLCFHEGIIEDQKLSPTNRSFSIKIGNINDFWVPHPAEKVDLGAVFFSPIRKHAETNLGKYIFNISFDKFFIKNDDILSEESNVADKVLMMGYPNGLWDEKNNFPIFRSGIAASHPALDFNGESVGVIDMACFPGSSGSPILILIEGGYADKKGTYHVGANKVIFLGLLYAGPLIPQYGEIKIVNVPTENPMPGVVIDQVMHLGMYVKAKEILVLCEHIKTVVTTLVREGRDTITIKN